MNHSDYISGYMAMGQVTKTLSIRPQSFTISKQQFFDQPIDSLNSSGVKYTRAPLAARGNATCSMVQTCQVNWTISIPKNTLAIQINKVSAVAPTSDDTAKAIVNFNGDDDVDTAQGDMTAATQEYSDTEVLHFWLGFSTACGPFNQFAIYKDSTKLWDTSIYAREQAVICSNSLSDLCTNNSVSVSPLESIIAGKRHCGVFIDVKLSDIIAKVSAVGPPLAPATPSYYLIPDDIIFSGVLDLNQLNPIFNSFPVLTRNYASLYLQLWMQDFLQDLKIVWLNKTDMVANNHLAYQMIPPEKPDIVYLLKYPTAEQAFELLNLDETNICFLVALLQAFIKPLLVQLVRWFVPLFYIC
ncbi:MAG: hypothetical protein EZS28_005188 [Streblomastix strix]|uniref:Uncharacterized protein n=1 Tax=Streblomastix strix TaxID=222440 RepID=A0A5J4WWJ1_9EUKA|nr:MAG: hypothetical protein EZS28_005188 [Streblomastix strix]